MVVDPARAGVAGQTGRQEKRESQTEKDAQTERRESARARERGGEGVESARFPGYIFFTKHLLICSQNVSNVHIGLEPAERIFPAPPLDGGTLLEPDGSQPTWH